MIRNHMMLNQIFTLGLKIICFFSYFLKYAFIFMCMCVCLHACRHLRYAAPPEIRRFRALNALKLDLQRLVSCHLGAMHQSWVHGQSTGVPNCRTLSLFSSLLLQELCGHSCIHINCLLLFLISHYKSIEGSIEMLVKNGV